MYRHSVFRVLVAMFIGLGSPLTASQAGATVINVNFAAPGSSASLIGGRFVAGPTSFEGGGDFAAIIAAAADMWEAVLADDRTFSINVGWSTFRPGILAAAASINDSRNEIAFNTAASFFADPTPALNEEFGGFLETSADFGGGPIASNRGFSSASIAGDDLLTVALHEIGHVLGNPFDLTRSPPLFSIFDGPFAGTVLPCAERGAQDVCGHLNIGGTLMAIDGGFRSFKRTLISGADLLFVATDGHFQRFDADRVRAQQVPEPGTMALVLSAMLGFWSVGWRQARATRRCGRLTGLGRVAATRSNCPRGRA